MHFRVSIGLSSVEAYDAFEPGSAYRRRKTFLDDLSRDPNKHLFMKYINMFIEATSFVQGISLFVDRNIGPTWFKNHFPGDSP